MISWTLLLPMNLWFRLLFRLLLSRFRSPCETTGPCLTPFRVLPTDLDIRGHVNNGVYFSLLDVAHVDMLIRSGKWPLLARYRWFPVVAAQTIQFHRELLPLQRFVVETQVIGWDARTFFIRHRFFRDAARQHLVAEATRRELVFQRGRGVVPMAEVFAAFGESQPSAPLPTWITDWANALDRARSALVKR